MLIKLFKYDFKNYIVKMVPAFIIYFSVCIINLIFNILYSFHQENQTLFVFYYLLSSLLRLATSAFSIYGLVLVVLRYARNCFKDEGYLTHTLPVTKHQIILSKYLLFIVNEVIAAITIIAGCCIAYGTSTTDISVTINEIAASDEIQELLIAILKRPDFVILALITIIALLLAGVTIIMMAIAIGHSFNKNKTLLSVVFYFVISYAIGFIGSIYIVFETIILSLNQNITTSGVFYSIDIPLLLFAIAFCVFGYYMTYRAMNSKLNLQ